MKEEKRWQFHIPQVCVETKVELILNVGNVLTASFFQDFEDFGERVNRGSPFQPKSRFTNYF